MITKNATDRDDAKKVFQSLKLEKPSPDFTLSIMNRIAKETVVQPVRKAPLIQPYYYLLPLPLIALFLPAPMLHYWITEIKNGWGLFYTSAINNCFLPFIHHLQFTLSPAMVSITIASFILVTLLALISYPQANNKGALEH